MISQKHSANLGSEASTDSNKRIVFMRSNNSVKNIVQN